MNASKAKLDKMLEEEDVPQTTDKIRKTKHSQFIKKDIDTYFKLRAKYKRLSSKQFSAIMASKCDFIFNNYHNLFKKLVSNKLDQDILHKFLAALKLIEDGKLNQHEASYKIGLLLKKIFVDQVIKHEDKKSKRKTKSRPKLQVNISWEEYKKLNM